MCLKLDTIFYSYNDVPMNNWDSAKCKHGMHDFFACKLVFGKSYLSANQPDAHYLLSNLSI